MEEKSQKIKLSFPANLQAGVYANSMLVTHTKEEFVMDFSFIASPMGTVTARVISSPGHMKRIIAALQENVKRYETKFGTIIQSEEPQGNIGYNA